LEVFGAKRGIGSSDGYALALRLEPRNQLEHAFLVNDEASYSNQIRVDAKVHGFDILVH